MGMALLTNMDGKRVLVNPFWVRLIEEWGSDSKSACIHFTTNASGSGYLIVTDSVEQVNQKLNQANVVVHLPPDVAG